ncbi:hypothetical protein LTR86_003769 [Recurvomyces mirabilis]|nr:hypothetical protein LTR86_003769 [Recurvomyces mirabilis]
MFAACLTIFLLASITRAFETNCTLPTESTAYVSSPNVRGTTDILWTCLATIFACTYTVLHLNVPEQRLGRDQGWKGDLRWRFQALLTNVKWAVVTVIAPELTLILSCEQLMDARSHLRAFQAKGLCTDQRLTLSHLFYANMGGFALLYHTTDGDEEVWHLNGQSLITVCESGEVDPKALISADDLSDKSKSDVVGKCLAVLQIGYFLVAILERAAASLVVSQLELGVCGFVGCSIAIYGACFHKPKSVQTVTIIKRYTEHIPEGVMKMIEDTSDGRGGWMRSQYVSGNRVRNDAAHSGPYNESYIILPLIAIALGGVHLAGWCLSFPSAVDQGIWRGASIASMVALPLFMAAAYLGDIVEERSMLDWISVQMCLLFYIMYAVSRLALMVEMFRCLFYLPPDAFKATSWAMSIPHIG